MSRNGEHVINLSRKCLRCGRTKDGGCLCKPSTTARKKAKVETVKYRAGHERAEKGKVRRRDKGCRFPLCGCRKLGLLIKARPEVSHEKHKGMGGNPVGDRSTADIMVHLCNHRHQDGAISRHKGTLRVKFLTSKNYDGPVAWLVDLEAMAQDPSDSRQAWREVARETAPGVLAPLDPWQREVLEQLAEMDL